MFAPHHYLSDYLSDYLSGDLHRSAIPYPAAAVNDETLVVVGEGGSQAAAVSEALAEARAASEAAAS